ncbi:prepilin-type N-terminal cleavage/methylation domain-containing protein [Phycisphaera mikurensis]|uniref:Prepilin-type N-terminal cleavage/methylation domain-containing protein n=1 Tax=Phycisphaera mikurensis (strain NBRC 102666 / KCTC 22515 / FYK2301M01) TaxID=1142394 RepID=I0IIB3_PHYMF|nr:prepilin-type N-terminal cleavage/methylation domain-containing protein [Phycisphaera mikurensis]MBB6442436.1 prepilin-type N-terminal cleavage/methylation domain-containing protein [Phycisphaera mikurensis]BAM05001.1 hypothetical protein PSMK_28420 [Phycisphaera mikurensis NBRC 102666]
MQQPSFRGGFTLLELLVVIAIIAAVAALSVPVMTKAFGVAAETQCISNLRSMTQANAAYTVDFKRRFPAGHGHDVWFLNVVGARGATSSSINRDADRRVLNPYLDGAVEVAVCPLDRGTTRAGSSTIAALWGTSYSYVDNGAATSLRRTLNGIWSLEGFGLNDVSSPATKSVFTDYIHHRSLAESEQHAWHGVEKGHLRTGMGFVDGHAETVRMKVEPTVLNPPLVRHSFGEIEAMAKSDPYY